ncbi:MAG: hypothetical protein ACREB7_02215 [Sphingopyxis sp.]|uniref:hypothetical protein n=1 Tax=Sphingopyxis sp. TaxID=1908224 RepID=UPI003D6D7653
MRRIDLSIPSERLIGFTIPRNQGFLVCDHDEVWEVVIGVSVSVEPTSHAPYEIAARSDFVGWGREDSAPILTTGGSTISYEFDPRADVLHLHYATGETRNTIEFPILSGDWFAASFSEEGDLVVLAEPYHLDLYQIDP